MPKLPAAGAELQLDTSKFDAGFKGAIADAAKLDAAISDLGGTVDLKVNVDSSELDTAVRGAADLDGTSSFKINVDDAELSDVSDQISTLTALTAIDLVINASGSALALVEGLGRFSGIGGVVEMDNAMAMLQARTGQMIPQADELINDIYTNGWGESRTQIAGVIVEATNLKIANEDLETAVTNALIIQSVYGQETNETLRTMDTMVKNNLAPDFQTAADILTTGFQTGADRGQDLLDTFNEYGSTFGNLRISGEGALAIINSGLDAGIDNSDRIADAIRETGIRLGEIGTTPAITDAFERLDELSEIDLSGMLDAFNAGEMSGDEFFQGFFTALGDAVEADPVEGQTLAATLVGTISEDFGVESIAQLTPIMDETMGALEGRTEEAGTAISDTLSSAIETALRQIEQMAVDFLSSDSIDLDGKIDDIVTGINNGLSALSGGATIDEAIEIAIGTDGLTEFIDNFERLIGNLSIAVLEAVALIQDPLGNNENDTATRRQIAAQGAGQFAFDIQIANPDEFEALITQAASRGVSAETIMATLNDTVATALAEGDFERALGAGTGLVDALAAEGRDTTAAQAYVDNLIATIKTEYETAIADLDLARADAAAGALGMEGAGQDAINSMFGFDPASLQTDMDAMETGVVNNMMGIQTATAEAGGVFTGTVEDIGEASEAAQFMSSDMATAFTDIIASATEADLQVQSALTGNTMTTSFEEVGVGASLMAVMVGKAMRKIREDALLADAVLTGIAAKVTAVNQAVAGAQTAANGGGGGGTVNNTNINVNNTNNVQSTAQAAANGYALGESVRGMS